MKGNKYLGIVLVYFVAAFILNKQYLSKDKLFL